MIAYVRGRQLPHPNFQSTLVTWLSGGGNKKIGPRGRSKKKNRIFEQYLFL